MAINAHLTVTDPLGLASAGVINIVEYKPSMSRGYLEAMAPAGKPLAAAVKLMKPLEQFDVTYDLLDTASLVVPFGVAVNTNYLITACSCDCGPEKYPRVSLSCIKPSSATLIKAYSGSISLTFVGGRGIVNKFGATCTSAFISSKCSVSMAALDAMDEVSGDFLVGGIYRFNFKQEMSYEAYAAIVAPAGVHGTPNQPTTPRQSSEGWQIYDASFWKYLDPA